MAAKRYSGGKRFRDEPPKRKGKKKLAIVLVSLLAACTVAATGTIAYLTTATNPVVNTFSPTDTVISIPEEFTGSVKKDVKVYNDKTQSSVDVFIRAQVVICWKDSSGNVYSQLPVADTHYTIDWGNDETTILGSDWVKGADGYYYYTKAVAPGDSTTNLIDECKVIAPAPEEGYTLSVEIIASAIQAQPDTAVETAWANDRIVINADNGNLSVTAEQGG